MPSLTFIGTNFLFRNKLQSEIFQFLRTQDRVHLEDYQVAAFKEQILLQIAQIRRDHPDKKNRIKYYWRDSNNNMDCFLDSDESNCDFRIYASSSIFID